MSQKSAQQLRIAIWGVTGATGSELLRQCLADPRIVEVRAFTRRPISTENSTVRELLVEDFLDLSSHTEELRGIDAAFWCLGVSQSSVPEEERYREITHDYALAASRALRQESPEAVFHFVSGMGADPSGRSRMMWARVKGETEAALATLGLRRLVVWRPAYIHVVAGRERRSLGYRLAMVLSPIFRLIPNMTNSTVDISQAMLHATFVGEGSATYESKAINQLAHSYRNATKTHTCSQVRKRWWS